MHLGSLESTQEARTLTHLSCSPNFPRVSITRYTHAKYEQILNLYKINLHCICTHENPTAICSLKESTKVIARSDKKSGFMIFKVLYLHFVPADSADHILSRQQL